MFSEKIFEDIICKYPELIEDNLVLLGRQVYLYNRRIDILFEDKFKRKLLIELKVGPIKDQHIGQILAYEGMLLSSDNPTIRVMLVGNRVPPNIQKSLDHHGIAWREITFSALKTFLHEKNDAAFSYISSEVEVTEFHNDNTTIKQIYADTPRLLHEYWTGLKNYMEANQSPVTLRRPKERNWDDISIGTSDTYISFAVNSHDNSLNIRLTLRGPEAKNRLRQLHRIAYNESLRQVNSDLVYDFMEGRQRCAVTLKKKADYRIRNEWINQFKWFKENLERFDRFFRPLVNQI